ncbi:MAG: hypothetical protein KTR19_04770 [Hyphomicrobiales bacterium]|nr:hypothetical protein [Hyphomicrobiales bacterium]
MAETSGFQTDLPQSTYLALSIERAISLAQQRSHRYVTLEHLLYTLMDDPSTTEILEGLQADMAGIRGNIAEAVNRGLTSLYTPGEFDLHASYKVERVLQTASDDADRLNCEEVDAAFVIAALSRESDNMASEVLKRNGVGYASAVSWLYANRGATTPSPRRNPTPAPEPEPEVEDHNLGTPAIDMPVPTPAQRGPVPGAQMRTPANAAPARERYARAPAPAPAQMQARHDAPKESPAVMSAPAEPAESTHDGDLLELEIEAVEEALSEVEADIEVYEEEALEPAVDSRASPPPPPPPPPVNEPEIRHRRKTSAPGGYAPPERPNLRMEPPPSPPPVKTPPNGNFSGYRGGGERKQYQGPPQPPADKMSMDPVPPVSRLDEMRLNRPRSRGEAPPAPAPAAPPQMGGQKTRRTRGGQVPAKNGRSAGGSPNLPVKRQRQRSPQDTIAGRLLENIPRKMRASVAERVEVRISREETIAILRGFDGRGDMHGHDINITQTMSVALRAPEGGFNIEPLNPETQWIFNRADENDVYGRWRWSVTPSRKGTRTLQLLVASRSVGANGAVADSALPDQVITINVRTNYWLAMGRGIKWIAVMILGGVLTELAMFGTRMLGL